LQLLTLVILSIHAAVSYEQSTGWTFRLNFQSDTFKSTLATFPTGLPNVFSTLGITLERLTPCGTNGVGNHGSSQPDN
jgi:hypothetical protein